MGPFLKPFMCEPTERDFLLPTERATSTNSSLSLSLTAFTKATNLVFSLVSLFLPNLIRIIWLLL